MTNTAITVLEETIYSDGSGSAGLYEVYGQRFSGVTTGRGGKVTVIPLGIRSGYRTGREKGSVRHAVRVIEERLSALV